MVEMSGYDFIRRLRATRVGRNVPVIALSSADDVETELQMLRAGVAAFISKGADPRILGAHIERLCLGLEGES
jgi:DNA-binding response OmpR family regulator